MQKKTRTRIWSILLSMTMLLSLLPVTAFAAENVPYVDEHNESRTCESATKVETSTTAWGTAGSQTWYVVDSDVTIENTRITVTGNVHLILADGAELKATKGIGVTYGNSLTIYGQTKGTGKLTAEAHQVGSAAAIGGNDDSGAYGDITINGGKISATGAATDAAGIGGGRSARGTSGTITINGGTVNATGGGNAAGIGGGYANQAAGGAIIINGGDVTARGTYSSPYGAGAGIGAGFSGAGMEITINGGTVNATGGKGAAGIGAGSAGRSSAASASITINGGTVEATGGAGAAGIGGGSASNASVGAIEISGSAEVHATGGNSDTYAGAGIGAGGSNSGVDIVGDEFVITPSCGTIAITGGTVDAGGGNGAAGIGGTTMSPVESVSISGGIFTGNTFPDGEIPEDYLAEGFTPVKNENGTWGVKEDDTTTDTGVAQIGDQTYATLEQAFGMVTAGTPTTIKLIADTQISSTIEILEGKNITLDLNGCAVTVPAAGSDGRSLYALNNYGTLTIKDTSGSGEGSITARGMQNLGSGVLTIESGTFVSCDANGGAAVWNEATAYINGGTFKTMHVGSASDNYGPGCLNNSGTAVITAGTFESVNKRTYAVISTGTITITPAEGKEVIVSGAHGGLGVDSGDAVVNGGSFSSTEYYGLYVSNDGMGADPMKAAVTVNGGTFTGANYSVWIGSDYNDPVNSSIAIYDGTFKKPLNAQANTREGAVQVYGGTFHQKVPQEYCADGFVPKQNDDGTWNVVEEATNVAQIGDTGYATLEAAIAAAGQNDTVKLLTDIDQQETLIIPADKTITLDLNGKTISGSTAQTSNFELIRNNGNLTIKDGVGNGKITFCYTGATSDWRYYSNTISNRGTLTLESGTVENTTQALASHIFFAIDNNSTINNANLTIEGGAVSCANYRAIRQFANSATYQNNVAISGGAIQGQIWLQSPNTNKNLGSLIISGGAITGNVDNNKGRAIYVSDSGEGSDISGLNIQITSGTIEGPVQSGVTDSTAEVFAISGGTFSEKPDDAYLAEGYSAYSVNGKYVVTNTISSLTLNPTSASLYTNRDPVTVRLTATLNDGASSDAITWSSSNENVATVSETGLVTAVGNGTATITAHVTDNIKATCTVTVSTYSAPTGSTGGGSSEPSGDYIVSVDRVSGGKVTVNPGRADKGDEVTVTVKPSEGYELASLTVTDKDGKAVELTKVSDTKYTFKMPASKVTVKAAFAEISEDLPFTDVAENAWYYDAVRFVYENGLMNGVTTTTFGPNVTTSRAMLATILYRLEGKPSVGSSDFTDVESGMYYTEAVTWASSKGIVTGYGDGTFLPNKAISREEMAAMLYRYASYKGYDVTNMKSLDGYSDAGSVSAYAVEALQWATGAGLVTDMGDGTLSPTGLASRAQIATILMRFLGE